jgi:hypothetical protein
MKRLSLNLAATAATAMLVASISVSAAVNVDEHGVGFVGKGDVQSVFDWNNSMLQSNAHKLKFKLSRPGTVSWYCEGVNAAGVTVRTNERDLDFSTNSYIAHDARRNHTGQISGFVLTGFTSNTPTYNAIGSCGRSAGFQVPLRLVSHIDYEGSNEPSLKVSIDGETWHELSITY